LAAEKETGHGAKIDHFDKLYIW